MNVGAGAGSYEPVDITAAAVEPSPVMSAQRPRHLVAARSATAENLPFEDGAFDGALAVLTIHHWSDPASGLRELMRVTRGPIVILTFDPVVASEWWLPAVYAPELAPMAQEDAPELSLLKRELENPEIRVLPVPARCTDGFLSAFWDRPELVLDPDARAATSGFARLGAQIEARISQELSADLKTGAWDERFGHLRRLPEFDSGLRLIVARSD